MVAFVVAFIAWIVTHDTVSSFLIGLVTEAIVLLIELRMEIVKTNEAFIGKVSLTDIVASYSSVRKLISDFEDVIKQANPDDSIDSIFVTEAKDAISEVAEVMADLKRGRLRVRGPMTPYIKGAIRIQSLKKGGFATAIVNSPNDWSGKEMQHFHQINCKLAKKGKLKITRIFIIKDKSFLEPGSPLTTVIRERHDAGINVRYVLFEELDPDLIRDVGFWDDKLVVNIALSPAGFNEAIYDTSPLIVKETRDFFERILMVAHLVSDIFKNEN